MKLADFVEQISDDFQSTFSVVDSDTLANMMGLPGDFDVMKSIVNRYIPGADVTFHKTNQLGEEEKYDIYLVRAVAGQAHEQKGGG